MQLNPLYFLDLLHFNVLSLKNVFKFNLILCIFTQLYLDNRSQHLLLCS